MISPEEFLTMPPGLRCPCLQLHPCIVFTYPRSDLDNSTLR
ncbi:hypothetical protein RDI58_019474 [Solanum bulbocastanum]|uniref:Uncharacterized protein n=1 Tax=Solanum bulbocastanum TaxID=147425 RepID=A0AAN8Y9P4_SOLBU